jgi:hypothetical protein
MEKVKKERNVRFLNPSGDAYVSHFWCCASIVVGGWLRRDIFRMATFWGRRVSGPSFAEVHDWRLTPQGHLNIVSINYKAATQFI